MQLLRGKLAAQIGRTHRSSRRWTRASNARNHSGHFSLLAALPLIRTLNSAPSCIGETYLFINCWGISIVSGDKSRFGEGASLTLLPDPSSGMKVPFRFLKLGWSLGLYKVYCAISWLVYFITATTTFLSHILH